jgi:hypothetical protein
MLWHILKYSVIVWELPENRSGAQVGERDDPRLNSCRTAVTDPSNQEPTLQFLFSIAAISHWIVSVNQADVLSAGRLWLSYMVSLMLRQFMLMLLRPSLLYKASEGISRRIFTTVLIVFLLWTVTSWNLRRNFFSYTNFHVSIVHNLSLFQCESHTWHFDTRRIVTE